MSGRTRNIKKAAENEAKVAASSSSAAATTSINNNKNSKKEDPVKEEDDAPAKAAPNPAATAVAAADTEVAEGTSTPASKEILRTVYWSAADRRFDQMSIEEDFQFDDETQTISLICNKQPRSFPNTHFMRRLAGHLRLGLGRNATKENILEKICQIHYGDAFTRPKVEDGGGSSSKRKSGDLSSTVLKKRPVITGRSKRGQSDKASALAAWSASLDSMASTIRQAEERLQKLCQAAGIDFYTALMDRSKVENEYLKTQFAEYDNFLEMQKQMVASMTELGKGSDDAGTLNPISAAAMAAALAPAAVAAASVAEPTVEEAAEV